jgi:hypothetical protein
MAKRTAKSRAVKRRTIAQFQLAVQREADKIAAARDRIRCLISDAEEIADTTSEAHDIIMTALAEMKHGIEIASQYV